jgi:class 3 adenylate cyclase
MWLRRLGLERYEPAFRDHEIDWEVLPELSEADFEKLDIPLGPRKKLLKAIAVLAAAGAPAAPEAKPTTIAPRAAERRQLTVMFVDLVGSTALAARLDPEEMGEVLRRYQAAVAVAIGRFEGHIAKYMGDGVLAYFGWPRAHEDAAERAVRAALAIEEAVARLDAPEPLRARIGIATGLVVVGDLIGEGAAREESVVGETPNLAARLQALVSCALPHWRPKMRFRVRFGTARLPSHVGQTSTKACSDRGRRCGRLLAACRRGRGSHAKRSACLS